MSNHICPNHKPNNVPGPSTSTWPKEDIVAKVKRGIEESKAGQGRPIEEVFKELE